MNKIYFFLSLDTPRVIELWKTNLWIKNKFGKLTTIKYLNAGFRAVKYVHSGNTLWNYLYEESVQNCHLKICHIRHKFQAGYLIPTDEGEGFKYNLANTLHFSFLTQLLHFCKVTLFAVINIIIINLLLYRRIEFTLTINL